MIYITTVKICLTPLRFKVAQRSLTGHTEHDWRFSSLPSAPHKLKLSQSEVEECMYYVNIYNTLNPKNGHAGTACTTCCQS